MNKTLSIFGLSLLTVASSAVAHPSFFQHIDTDGDGALTRAEVENSTATRAQVLDANGDGTITLEELQADLEPIRKRMLQRRLAAADRDGDGIVSLHEFSDGRVERIMRRDSNGDGIISEDERPKRSELRGPHGEH